MHGRFFWIMFRNGEQKSFLFTFYWMKLTLMIISTKVEAETYIQEEKEIPLCLEISSTWPQPSPQFTLKYKPQINLINFFNDKFLNDNLKNIGEIRNHSDKQLAFSLIFLFKGHTQPLSKGEN